MTSSLLCVWLYPGSDRWTPARGDTTAAMGSYLGVHLGSWLNYQLGMVDQASTLPPYTLMSPTLPDICLMLLRVLLGGLVAGLSYTLVKPLTIQAATYWGQQRMLYNNNNTT